MASQFATPPLHPPSVAGAEIYGILNHYKENVVKASAASRQELTEAFELPKSTDPRVQEARHAAV